MPDLVAIAKAALLEITPEATIGAPTGQAEEAGATTVTFQANMAGYPGWHWTVSVATLDDAEPSVLEVELMPGNGALLAPDWVPWSERLAEYQAAQEAQAAEEAADDSDEDDDESDDDDEHDDDEHDDDEHEDEDDDDLGSDVLHAGDLDGVDIDSLDTSDDESDDDDESDEDEDEIERSY